MENWHEEEGLIQERLENLRRDRKNSRLYRQMRATRRSPLLHRRMLAWLGHRLIVWGQGLLARHGDLLPEGARSTARTHA